MTESPLTHPILIMRLRDFQDADAWRRFVAVYTPLIYRYARSKQLQDADAQDLTQEVLQSVSKSIGQLDYDPDVGSFRGWLFTIVHRRIFDFWTQRKTQLQGIGNTNMDAFLQNLPAIEEEIWDEEYHNQVFLWAVDQIKNEFAAKTWQAFYKTAVDGRTVSAVAGELGLSTGAVYIARTRVKARLKEKIEQTCGD